MRLRVMYLGLIVGMLVSPIRFGRLAVAYEMPRKVAILAGVNEYRDRQFAKRPLRYAERDMKELAIELKRQGFTVHLLTGSDATKAKIEKTLKDTLQDRATKDLLFLGFSGQGVQMPLRDEEGKLVKDARGGGRNDVLLCSVDSVSGDGSTMLSLTRLFDQPDLQRGLNVVLVDACRSESLGPNEGMARVISGDELAGRIPQDSVVFFSCAAGQEGLETAKAGGGHGLFFYHVIEALRGSRAVEPGSTEVSWDDLTRFVQAEVKVRALEWWSPDQATDFNVSSAHGKLQTPHLLDNLVGNPDLAQVRRSSPVSQRFAESIGIKLKSIPAGRFQMGSPKAFFFDSSEQPRHEVRISRAFSLGATEVTQAQYRAVTGDSPSRFEGSDDLPVERVSWLDAVRFCNALSIKEGRLPFYKISGETVSVSDWKGIGYRLPTEAEWEYACRAGNSGLYSFGNDASELREHAWFFANSEDKTHPVGQKRANGFDLHDMHGNVDEWCWDSYAPDSYSQSPDTDPRGPLGFVRVVRGGSWLVVPSLLRSAARFGNTPLGHASSIGFRVARGQSGE